MKPLRAIIVPLVMFGSGVLNSTAFADDDVLRPVQASYAAVVGGNNPAFFSKRLMALHDAAVENSEMLQEPVPGLDFSYVVNGQDFEDGLLESVKYEILSQDKERAEVKVTFNNFGEETLGYSLLLEDGLWSIDEVKCMSPDCTWVYSELLKEGADYKPAK